MKREELINVLKKQDHFIIAIDGMSASGKSHLAAYIQEQLGGHVFHMDDFFLQPHMRTKERLEEPGGNVDYERFLETVLKPLSQKQTVSYQPFSCSSMTLQQSIEIPYHRYNIIEGSYSLREELVPYYTHCVVLRISQEEQKQRIQKRNPHSYEQFINVWIPLENKYLEYYDIYKKYPIISHI